MRLLVTGGCGFIGRYAARAALARGDDVVLYDVVPPAGGLASRVTFVAGDLGSVPEIDAVLAFHRPNAVLHLAAVVGAPASMSAPIESTCANIEATVNLLVAVQAYGPVRFVHLSSEETYGDFAHETIDEDHPQLPVTPYGIAKSAAEGFCRYYRRNFGVDAVTARTSWVYGVGLARTRPPGSLLEPAARGEPASHPTGADFVVDYTSVYDVAEGLLQLASAARLEHDVYHLTSGEATQNGALVGIIEDLIPGAQVSMGPGPWFFATDSPAPRKGAMRHERATRDFAYRPTTLRAGLQRYLADLRSGENL